MQQDFPELLRELCTLDQEEALTQERIFALAQLLDKQHELLQRLYDHRSYLEAVLARLCDATIIYEVRRDGQDDC